MPGPFRPDELDLRPIDLFDWDELTWRDFRYYRVRIERCDRYPNTAGQEALVDVKPTSSGIPADRGQPVCRSLRRLVF